MLFILFGAGFIAAPNALSLLLTGAAPGTPSAVTDMRATYGGTALGLGLFFGLCARNRVTLRAGLLASLDRVIGDRGREALRHFDGRLGERMDVPPVGRRVAVRRPDDDGLEAGL